MLELYNKGQVSLAPDQSDSEYAANTHNIQWEGKSSGSLGFNYYLQGNFQKAIPLIELEIKIGKQYKDWRLVADYIHTE